MSATIKLIDRGGAELTLKDNQVSIRTLAQSHPLFVDSVARTFQTFVDTTVWTAYEPDPDLNRTTAFVAQSPHALDIVDWDVAEDTRDAQGVLDA